ncbi:MAG: endonuclease III [Vicinamibacterales bacterium]
MKSRSKVLGIVERLRNQHPAADTELAYRNAYELLVATVLSAQTTDQRVNQVTPALFARFPDARALASADPNELERLVQPTGFFRQKARALIGMANGLVDRHGGRVPADMDALVRLPGVGRKTANVVLGHALGVAGLAVDRHVLRVANRIGLAGSDDPEVVERQLTAVLPEDLWTLTSDTLILHGRRICKPRPLCDRCAVRQDCDFFREGRVAALAAAPQPRRRRRPAEPGEAGASGAPAGQAGVKAHRDRPRKQR